MDCCCLLCILRGLAGIIPPLIPLSQQTRKREGLRERSRNVFFSWWVWRRFTQLGSVLDRRVSMHSFRMCFAAAFSALINMVSEFIVM